MPNTLENIRNYAASLEGEERKAFINKFNSIKDDDAKIETLGSRIAALSTPKRQFNTIEEASSAMKQANVNQSIAQRNVENIDPLVSLGRSAYNLSWPVSAVANKIINKGSPVPEATTSGGRLMQDLSAIANPLVGRAVGYGLEKTGKAIGTAIPLTRAAIGSVGDAVRALKTRVSGTKSAEFANKIRTAFVNVKKDAVDKFGKGLEDLTLKNPNKKIDLFDNNNINSILDDKNLPLEIQSIFKRTPILRDILEKKRSSQVTLKESQDIINYIQTKVPAQIKASHIDLPEFLSEMRIAQSNAFPKEMATLRSEYAKIAQPFKDVKSQMRFNQLLGAIDKNFGGAEGKQAIKELFKDNPSILREMGGYKKAGYLIKGALGASGLAGTYAVGKGVFDKN